MTDHNARSIANDRLTARERRRRLTWLALLLALLMLVGGLTALYLRNRSLPNLALLPEGQTVVPPKYIFSITGSGKDAVSGPTGVAIAQSGDVYVADFDRRRVSVYSRSGDFKFAFNKISGEKSKELRAPVNVTIADGKVWVTDRRLRGIYLFDLDGTFDRKFEPKGLKGNFTPLAIDVAADGDVRVTDVGATDSHRLVLLGKDGKTQAAVGQTAQAGAPEEQTGKFFFPAGIAVASDGRVFVADGDNRRVQVFDKAGEFKYIVNTSGVPRGLAIDPKNRLYVVDALAHSIGVYSLDGEQVVEFGSQGFGPGQFNFPNDIAVGGDQRLYITDRQNHQIQVWEWPAAAVPAPLAGELRNWWPLLLPLLLLPLLLLLRRKRRYVLTPDFVTALVEAGSIGRLQDRKSFFSAPETDAEHYAGKEIDGVKLDEVIHLEPFSPSDVAVIQDRFGIEEKLAVYIAKAERAHALLTDDHELIDVAIMADIRVIDSREFRAKGKAAAQTA